jgi:hypothetical protein
MAGALVAVALVGVLAGVGLDRIVSVTLAAPATALVSSLPHPAANPAPAQNTNPSAPAATNPGAGAGSATSPDANAAPRGSRRGTQPGSSGQSQPGGGQPADPATQQAIQQVIQQGDDEQAQAVASKDLAVMADTSTPDYLKQVQQDTRDLLEGGVTSIKLANVEWGPITVNGTTATATAYETWTTTFSDGSTDQSRDRNAYTLVQDNGTWKVQADEHPDQQQAFPGGGSLPPGLGIPSPRQQPQPSAPQTSPAQGPTA